MQGVQVPVHQAQLAVPGTGVDRTDTGKNVQRDLKGL